MRARIAGRFGRLRHLADSDPALNFYSLFALACFANILLTSDYYQGQAYVLYALIPVGVAGQIIRRRYAPARSGILLFAGLYLLMILISSLLAGTTDADWVAVTMRATSPPGVLAGAAIVSMAIISFIYITIDLSLRRERTIEASILILGSVVAAAALINAISFLSTTPIEAVMGGARLTAVIGMPHYQNSTNISATYAVFAGAAVGVMASPSARRAARLVALALAAILLVAIALTQSRSAMVGLGCGAAAIAAVSPRSRRLIVAGTVAIGLAAVLLAPEMVDSLIARGLSRRPEVWAHYLDLATRRPWTGHGGFTAVEVVLANGRTIGQAHNLAISALVRGGIGASLAFLALMASSLWWAFRYRRETGNAGPLGAIVTIAAAGMVDYELVITRPDWYWITFWFPIALAAGCEMVSRDRAGTEGRGPSGCRIRGRPPA